MTPELERMIAEQEAELAKPIPKAKRKVVTVEGPLREGEEVALSVGDRKSPVRRFEVGRVDEIKFDIVTNAIVTMRWTRSVPEYQRPDALVERNYNPFSKESMGR